MSYFHHLNENLPAIREIVEEIYDNFPENIESIIENVTTQMTSTNANYDETQIDRIYNFILSLNKTFQNIRDPWEEFLKLKDSKILDIDLGFQAGLGFLGCHKIYGIEYPIDNDQLFLIQMTNLYAIQQYVEIILSGEFDSKCDELYKDIYNHMLAFWICIKNKGNAKEKVIGQYLRVVIMKNPDPEKTLIVLQNCGIDGNIINTLNNAITENTKMKEYKTFGVDTLKVTPLSHLYFPFQNLLNNIEILKERLGITSFETIPKYLLYIRLFKKPNTNIYEWKVTDTTLFKKHLKQMDDDTDLQNMFQLPKNGKLPSQFDSYKKENTFIKTAINDLFNSNIRTRSIINNEIKHDINTEENRIIINEKRTPKNKYPAIPPFQFQDLNSLKSDPSALVKQLFRREIDVSEICGITGNEIVYVQDETYRY